VEVGMLDYEQISRIVDEVASPILGDTNVVRVFAEPGKDADRNDIVRVTIVLAAGAVDRVDDEALSSTLINTNKRLRKLGEERQSILFYTTEEELATSGDPEP
jgi:hypothetical protein